MGIYGNLAKAIVEDQYRVLHEETVCKKDGLKIDVYPQNTRLLKGNPNNAYFEVYDNENYKKANKIIRLSVGYPWIIYHKSKKENWEMSSAEKEKLQEILNSPTQLKGYEGTVYQSILQYYDIPSTWPMPDFTNMKIKPTGKDEKQEIENKTKEHDKILEEIKKKEDKERQKQENMNKMYRR